MKKIVLLLVLYLMISFIPICQNIKASCNEYTTFSEIMMPEGKLLTNFTEEEMNKMYQHVEKLTYWGINVYKENVNIDSTYISNTLYSVENKGATEVTYDIEVDVETTNKVSFNASGSLNGSASGTSKGGVKGEIGAKCGVEVSNSTTTSRKEKQKMKIIVEPNSRAIVYLTGNLSVTNGVAACYVSFVRICRGGFEIVTLKNQYARVEKVQI